jgi:hypothetical protein
MMSTDQERSFVATLTVAGKLDARGNRKYLDLDFSYVALVEAGVGSSMAGATGVLSSGNIPAELKNISDQYLYANSCASEPVELYFRYVADNDYGGGYKIWVRSGPFTGKLLAKSNNGYMYANINYDREDDFCLVQDGKIVTLDDIQSDTPSIGIQLQYNKTYLRNYWEKSIQPYSSNLDFRSDYIVDGGSAFYFNANIKERNADFVKTDKWGKALG